MIEFDMTVNDPSGIHARPAGILVKKAQGLSSEIRASCKGKTADLKRLISVMTLGAKQGDVITISVSGENEKEDASVLRSFVESSGL